MTHPSDDDATASWSSCRRAFARRATNVPELAAIPQVIDRIVDQGLATSLYASSSVDNLVISDTDDWRKCRQKIVVIPKQSTIELRFYRNAALVEQMETDFIHMGAQIDRLVSKLLQNGDQP